MLENVDPELLKAGTSLGTQIVKDSSKTIFDRIKIARTNKQKDEIINELQEIITELVDERSQLVQLTQVYEEQLIAQRMSEEDIEYITNTVVPLLEKVLYLSDTEDTENVKEAIEILKPLLSKETFSVLQLVGFNFKKAIGEPLTNLLSKWISSHIPISQQVNAEYNILIKKVELELLKIAGDEEAYERYQNMINQKKG